MFKKRFFFALFAISGFRKNQKSFSSWKSSLEKGFQWTFDVEVQAWKCAEKQFRRNVSKNYSFINLSDFEGKLLELWAKIPTGLPNLHICILRDQKIILIGLFDFLPTTISLPFLSFGRVLTVPVISSQNFSKKISSFCFPSTTFYLL